MLCCGRAGFWNIVRRNSQAGQNTQSKDTLGLNLKHRASTMDSKVLDDILEILKVSKTDSCSLVLMKVGANAKTTYQSYQVQEDGKPKAVENDTGTLIYPIASVTKLLIAIALHLIIDIYSKSGRPEHKRYKSLDRWDLRYVEIMNACSSPKVLEPLKGNPTVEQLLLHKNGLPDLNRFLFSPDDTTIISEEGFMQLAALSEATLDSETSNSVEYSSANYVLIGILIERISEMSLGEFIKTQILQPLKMEHTYVSLEDLKTAPTPSMVSPYIIDREGRRVKGRSRTLLSNVVEIAALGIYSCTSDLAILYRALFPNSPDDPTHGILNKASIDHLFGYNSAGLERIMSQDGLAKWAAAGMVTKTAGKNLLGSRSAIYLALTDDTASNFALGTTPDDEDFNVHYQAGLVSTFSCSAYVVYHTGHIVVVMSNTLGHGDAADYISRLLLQKSLGLAVRDLNLATVVRSPRREVILVDKARQGCGKFSKRWSRKWNICEMAGRLANSEMKKLEGLYTNDRFVQSLRITVDGTELLIEFIGEKHMCSGRSRLASLGPGKLLICPETPSIDWFDAWEDLELHYESKVDEEIVRQVSSNYGKAGLVVDYIRQS